MFNIFRSSLLTKICLFICFGYISGQVYNTYAGSYANTVAYKPPQRPYPPPQPHVVRPVYSSPSVAQPHIPQYYGGSQHNGIPTFGQRYNHSSVYYRGGINQGGYNYNRTFTNAYGYRY